MSDLDATARPLTALRSRGLKGRFRVPAEPMITSLALMLAATARGETVVYADTAAADPNVAATLRLLAAVGAEPEVHDDRWHINGLGPLGLLAPRTALPWDGAGRALPLAMGLVGPYPFPTQVDGEDPTPRPLVEALRALGVEIREQRTGRLPVTLRGPLTGVPFVMRLPADGGVELEAALLLAALALPGVSTLTGADGRGDHARRLLRHFGATITEIPGEDGLKLEITGLAALGARTLTIAGDPDLAALAAVAALVIPDSEIVIENVPVQAARRGLIDALIEMGGEIELLDARQAAGEEIADLKVSHSALLGIDVEPGGLTAAGTVILATAGAFAAGETWLPRAGFAGEAALQQSLAASLSANGAVARIDDGGLVVGRPPTGTRLGGGSIDTGDDPLRAAAMLVFGLATPEPVTIADERALHAAYPALTRSLEGIGAEFYRRWTP